MCTGTKSLSYSLPVGHWIWEWGGTLTSSRLEGGQVLTGEKKKVTH